MSANLRSNGDDANGNGHHRLPAGWLPERRRNARVETSLRDVYRIFFRHRRKVACFFLAAMVIANVYVFFSKREYRSEAKLFVKLGRENVGLDATTTLGQVPPVAIPLSREEEINTVVEVLGSQSLLEKVVDAVGPAAILGTSSAKDGAEQQAAAASSGGVFSILRGGLEALHLVDALTPREQALARLKKEVGVEAVKKTNVVIVSHEGPDPRISQQIVSKLVDFYLDEHVRMNRTTGAHSFLEQQAAAIKSDLDKREDELRLLKNSTGLASPTEQRQALVLQIGHLQEEGKTTEASASAAEAETKELRKRLAAVSETEVLGKATGMPNVAADGMRQQLYTLQLKEKDLATRATDQHIELKFVREQIADAQAILNDLEPTRTQVTTGPNRTHEELKLALLRQESVLASLRAKATTITAQLVDARRQLETLNNAETQIARLQRDIQIRDANYRKYSESLEQSRIDESLERQRISNINIAQPPTLSYNPVGTKPLATLLIAFIAAVFGSLCVALGSEYVDHSLKTPDEIEARLRLPVLVSVPKMKRRQLVPYRDSLS